MMENNQTQWLKGILDLCLLALIDQAPCYGYEMVQRMTERGFTLVSEGSIYPCLSRLQHQKLVESYSIASLEGPKRKYYRLLPAGQEQLVLWKKQWHTFATALENILEGSIPHVS